MHNVHRDSLVYKKTSKKKNIPHEALDHDDHMHGYDATAETDHGHVHEHGTVSHSHKHRHAVSGIDGQVHGEDDHHGQDDHVHEHGEHDHDHDHDHHGDSHHREHDHDIPHGHTHEHDENDFEDHDEDVHHHRHDREEFVDHAYTHMHEHGHAISHAHHHSHHPEHTTLVHRVLKDPVRDWFGAGLMAVLIVVGYKQMLPGPLSDGALVCAAIIGIFPLFKNALFASIAQRRVRLELVPCLALVVGLFSGLFFETALAALLLLIGSFMRLNFSWKEH